MLSGISSFKNKRWGGGREVDPSVQSLKAPPLIHTSEAADERHKMRAVHHPAQLCGTLVVNPNQDKGVYRKAWCMFSVF